jgi:hypothetical protein
MRLTHRPDVGGSKDLWKVGKLLPDYTALQPSRQPSKMAYLVASILIQDLPNKKQDIRWNIPAL